MNIYTYVMAIGVAHWTSDNKGQCLETNEGSSVTAPACYLKRISRQPRERESIWSLMGWLSQGAVILRVQQAEFTGQKTERKECTEEEIWRPKAHPRQALS